MAKRKHAKRRAATPKLQLRAREREVLELWEEGVERIARVLAAGRARERPAPAEKPEAIIKMEVYRLVNTLIDRRYKSDFESALIHKMESSLPRVSFDANPYYWALKAISLDGEVEVKENVISKYASQLGYASRHQIPAELMIGFIYQVGGIGKIAKKLNAGDYEEWYRADLSWLRTG